MPREQCSLDEEGAKGHWSGYVAGHAVLRCALTRHLLARAAALAELVLVGLASGAHQAAICANASGEDELQCGQGTSQAGAHGIAALQLCEGDNSSGHPHPRPPLTGVAGGSRHTAKGGRAGAAATVVLSGLSGGVGRGVDVLHGNGIEEGVSPARSAAVQGAVGARGARVGILRAAGRLG